MAVKSRRLCSSQRTLAGSAQASTPHLALGRRSKKNSGIISGIKTTFFGTFGLHARFGPNRIGPSPRFFINIYSKWEAL